MTWNSYKLVTCGMELLQTVGLINGSYVLIALHSLKLSFQIIYSYHNYAA